jgi:hypothetical protein
VADGAPGDVIAINLLEQAQARKGGLPEIVVGSAEAGHQRPPREKAQKVKAPAMAKESLTRMGSLQAALPWHPAGGVVLFVQARPARKLRM